MKQKPIQIDDKYRPGQKVWINPALEAVREEECLCLNCDNFKPGTPEHCKIARDFFKLILKHKDTCTNKFPMSACTEWKPKTNRPNLPK